MKKHKKQATAGCAELRQLRYERDFLRARIETLEQAMPILREYPDARERVVALAHVIAAVYAQFPEEFKRFESGEPIDLIVNRLLTELAERRKAPEQP